MALLFISELSPVHSVFLALHGTATNMCVPDCFNGEGNSVTAEEVSLQ